MTQASSIQPGSIDIVNLAIRSPRRSDSLQISELCREINIYSSIYSPYMTINLLMLDASSLFTLFPITGDEFIDVEFKVDDSAFLFPFKRSFRVASITDLDTHKQPRTARYRLRGVDPEAYNDWTKLVRKSYADMTVSDMAKQVFNDYIKTDSSNTQFTVSSSQGNRTLVIPAMTPFETMKFFCREAWSTDYPASNFWFYSAQDGFHFTTLDELIGKKKVFDKYTLKEKNYFNATDNPLTRGSGPLGRGSTVAGKPEEWLKISDYKFISIMDMENNIRHGMLSNTHNYIDISASFFEQKSYSYKDDYDKIKKLDSNPGGKILYEDSDLLNSNFGDSYQIFTPTNKSSAQENIDTKSEFLHLSVGANALLNNVNLEMTVPGDCTRIVGDVIRISIPEYSSFTNTIDKENIFLSGDYLVTMVRHTFNPNGGGYITVMQCLKNSYAQSPEYSDDFQQRKVSSLNNDEFETTTPTPTSTPTYPTPPAANNGF